MKQPPAASWEEWEGWREKCEAFDHAWGQSEWMVLLHCSVVPWPSCTIEEWTGTHWQILLEFISWSWSSHTTDAGPWDKVMMQTLLYGHRNWYSWWNWHCNVCLKLQMGHYSIEWWSRIWKWPTTPLEANSTLGKTPVMSPSSEIGQDCWHGTLIQIHTFRHGQQKRCWWQTTSAKKQDWWFFLNECTR